MTRAIRKDGERMENEDISKKRECLLSSLCQVRCAPYVWPKHNRILLLLR